MKSIEINEKEYNIPKLKGKHLESFLEFSEKLETVDSNTGKMKELILYFLKFTDKSIEREFIDELELGDLMRATKFIQDRNPSLFKE
jgi:hypothetical protein